MSTQTATVPPALVDVVGNDESLHRFPHGLPGVEAVGPQARAAALATRAVKTAGGIRAPTDAIRYLVAVHRVAGSGWRSPRLFRFGASGLLGELLRQRRAHWEGPQRERPQREGHCSNADSPAVD